MQLDLFLHSRDVMLQNDVTAALGARNVASGQQALARFAAEFPHHEFIAPATTLLTTLTSPESGSADRDHIADRIREIEAVVVPAAHRVFARNEATKWLGGVWSSLAHAAAGLSFHPEYPSAHAGFLYLRSGSWAAAEDHIAMIPSWRRIPQPLAWMAEARFHRAGLESVWSLLMELAWIDPAALSQLGRHLGSPHLLKLWKEFEAGLGEEAGLDASWFPAWLLITAPKMALVMRQSQAGNGKPPERAARLIMELLALEKQGRHAELVAQRRTLRDLHRPLYEYYMSSR